jgi:hypothetical protein
MLMKDLLEESSFNRNDKHHQDGDGGDGAAHLDGDSRSSIRRPQTRKGEGNSVPLPTLRSITDHLALELLDIYDALTHRTDINPVAFGIVAQGLAVYENIDLAYAALILKKLLDERQDIKSRTVDAETSKLKAATSAAAEAISK